MYVAVKGGEKAIANAHKLLDEDRRGDTSIPAITTAQIEQQLSLSVNRVMAEGSLYDKGLAALAIKQARGDLIEAIFLIRAYRTTLPRFGYSLPLDSNKMQIDRRISATFKDLPGGQILGPTFDYTHRLLDFALAAEGHEPMVVEKALQKNTESMPRVLDNLLHDEGLIQREPRPAEHEEITQEVGDITRAPLDFPADRSVRLQNLARGDEGFLLSMGYSTQRGYARNHAFIGEIRFGKTSLVITPEELDFPIDIGDVEITECETVNQFQGSKTSAPQFTRGYGLAFGQNERKVIAMSLVDRALRADEMGEDITSPAQDEEFILAHSDNIQATGFVEHIKLPHYVDFQSELALVRQMCKDYENRQKAAESDKKEAAHV